MLNRITITKPFPQNNAGNDTKLEGIILIYHPTKIIDIVQSYGAPTLLLSDDCCLVLDVNNISLTVFERNRKK